ncbi:MAG: glycosyltransferase family 4 protein [Candidatus Hodarchaeota archaeon]
MKIIHVPPRYFPAISGSEFYFQRISEILKGKHSIEVHCTNALDFGAFHDTSGKIISSRNFPERVNGVDVYRHSIDFDGDAINNEINHLNETILSGGDFHEASISKNGPYSKSLREHLEEKSMDLIHATCFPYMNIFQALSIARMKTIPCLVTPFIHGENPRYQDESISLLNHFTKILACSRSEADFLTKKGIDEKKIEQITMGVDVDRYMKATQGEFLEYAGIEGEKSKIVLFCGYKNYEKGAISLLKTIPNVVRRIPGCKFVMIGPSTTQYNLELKKLGRLRKNVINLNPASLSGYFDGKKLGAFQACDIYVMPSRSEAYGIAYLEAWASKKPVISSNIPAMKDLFQHGKEGLQVTFDNVKDIARSIIQLLEDGQLREKMGQNGFQKIQDENLTWKSVSERISTIYHDTVA